MKVKFFSSRAYEQSYLKTANTQGLELEFEHESLSYQNIHLATGFHVVSVFTNDDVSEEVLTKLKDLGVRHVSIRAAGYNNVAIPMAKKLGITVANVPEYSPYSVAEHTVGMILSLNRKYQQMRNRVLQNNFTLDGLEGFDLNGKTVGIVGYGRIGKVVAKIMKGFGCILLAYDVSPSSNKDYGVRYTSLNELLTSSDIVTLHAPLTESTQHLINKESLRSMKKGAMLINAGRGPLVDTAAVIESLKAGHLGYFGLDVYEKEKGVFFYDRTANPPEDAMLKELLNLDNVLIAPHMGFLTTTALKNIADTTFENIDAWASGQKSPNELT